MIGLGEVLAEKILRHVAIVAGGDGVVRRLLPAIEMLVHDVAVDARVGIVREITEPLSEIECVAAHARENAAQRAKQHAGQGHSQEPKAEQSLHQRRVPGFKCGRHLNDVMPYRQHICSAEWLIAWAQRLSGAATLAWRTTAGLLGGGLLFTLGFGRGGAAAGFSGAALGLGCLHHGLLLGSRLGREIL